MALPKDYARRFVRGGTTLFVGLVGATVFALALRMFLARALTKEDFGLFYGMLALVSMFTLFRGFGVSPALVKFIPEFKAKRKYDAIKSSIHIAMSIEAMISLTVGLALFFLPGKIAPLVLSREVSPGTLSTATTLLRILGVWFAVGWIYVMFGSVFQGFQEMLLAAVDMFLNPLIFSLVIVFVSFFHQGVEGVAYAYVGAVSVMGLAWYLFFRKRHPEVLMARTSITKPLVKKLYLFSIPILLGGLASVILGYMDTLTITKFRTPVEVATYNAALSVARLLSYIPLAVGGVLLPLFSEVWAKGEPELANKILGFVIKFSSLFILPLVLLFLVFPEIILRLLFGNEFLEGVLTLQILSVAMGFMAFFIILGSALAGIGRPAINTTVIVTIGIVNMVGNLLVVPLYGMEGAAAVTSISWLLGACMVYYFSKRHFKFALPKPLLLKAVVGGFLTLFLFYSLKSLLPLPLWPKLLAVSLPPLLFYLFFMLRARVIKEEDLELMREILPMPNLFFRVAKRVVSRGFT